MPDDRENLFDEYIIQEETSSKQRAENWQIVIGLQDVALNQNLPALTKGTRPQQEGQS